MLRNQTFEKKSRPLTQRLGQLQRTMGILEQRGITPDIEALKQVSPSVTPGAPDRTDDLTPTDVGALFPPTGAGPASASPGNIFSALSNEGAAGLVTPGSQTRNVLSQLVPNSNSGLFAPGSIESGAGNMLLRGATFGLLPNPSTIARVVGGRSAQADMANVPGSLAGLATGGDFNTELARQRSLISTIDNLIPRVDPARAGQLRALRYAPEISEDAIASIINGQPARPTFPFPITQ
jgi:hypothetical protein